MPAFLSVFLGWPKLSACWPVELDCSGHRPFAGELGHGRSRNWTRDWAQYWPVDILNELLTARAGQEIQTRETYIHIRFFRSSLSISSFLGIAYSADLPVQNKLHDFLFGCVLVFSVDFCLYLACLDIFYEQCLRPCKHHYDDDDDDYILMAWTSHVSTHTTRPSHSEMEVD